MAIYGYIRGFSLKGEKPPEVQIAEMEQQAGELGDTLVGTFVDPDDSGKRIAILARPAGQQMLATLQPGDALIVTSLDRLGYSMRDVHKTVRALCQREVRIHVLHATGRQLELDVEMVEPFLQLFALWADTEKALRSERFTESARRRKENGLAYGGLPTGRRIVERDGVKVLDWGPGATGIHRRNRVPTPHRGPGEGRQ